MLFEVEDWNRKPAGTANLMYVDDYYRPRSREGVDVVLSHKVFELRRAVLERPAYTK